MLIESDKMLIESDKFEKSSGYKPEDRRLIRIEIRSG